MEKKQIKSRRFQFTIPNYTQEDLERFHKLAESLEKHRYISYGLEVAESGLPHIQGYVELNSAQRYAFLQKYFDFKKEDGTLLKFHAETAISTAEANKKYTQKDGKFYEFGEPLTQGARTDLSAIKEAVKANPKNISHIIDEYAQNNNQLKFAENLQRHYLTHRDPAIPPKVYWIFGRTGIGKTSLVFRTFDDICSVSDFNWIGTGYSQQECLLFDDFREFNLSFELLIKLIDRYPFTLFYKGGSIPLNSPFIIFTSPYGIDATFRPSRENLEQLRRRIIEIDLDMIDDVSTIDLRNYPSGA